MGIKINEGRRHGVTIAVFVPVLVLMLNVGCTEHTTEAKGKVDKSATTPDRSTAQGTTPEPKSRESTSVDPAVQAEMENMEAEKRAILLKDAQSALEETRNALAALDKGDKQGAIDALARATGKLDLVVARDPHLALAPVSVTTTIFDLYTTPETVKALVKQARDDLSNEQVQSARRRLENLASEGDILVTSLPLGTYPAAIKVVTPLIDAGKTEEAKAALYSALTTLVVDTFAVPLPKVRAEALLQKASELAAKRDRKPEDNAILHDLLDASNHEIQLAEALGYGTKDSYKPLYAQIDEIQKQTESGQSGKNLFARLRQSLKNFRFTS